MYYPICLDVRNQTCLVVGGGRVAAGKAIALAQAGAVVRVVAPGFERFCMLDAAVRLRWGAMVIARWRTAHDEGMR